jgi:hypothetical protein
MKRSLDEILGITKTQTKHDFQVDDAVVLNKKQRSFKVGRTGVVTGFDKYNLVVVKLDHLPNSRYFFHPSQLDKFDG